jgi:hypothetical protein
MPFSVSGLSNRHLQKVADRFDIKRPLVVGAGTSANAKPTAIVAGGNLVASLSYGDVTYAGIGTATAVCGNQVLAFGHPMLWSGPSTLSMHGPSTSKATLCSGRSRWLTAILQAGREGGSSTDSDSHLVTDVVSGSRHVHLKIS